MPSSSFQNASVDELLLALGEHLKAYRIRQGLSQSQLAERAGIGTVALSHLETGHGSSLRSFVRVLRTLGLQDALVRMVPGEVFDPLSLTRQATPRRRVKHRRRTTAAPAPAAGE